MTHRQTAYLQSSDDEELQSSSPPPAPAWPAYSEYEIDGAKHSSEALHLLGSRALVVDEDSSRAYRMADTLRAMGVFASSSPMHPTTAAIVAPQSFDCLLLTSDRHLTITTAWVDRFLNDPNPCAAAVLATPDMAHSADWNMLAATSGATLCSYGCPLAELTYAILRAIHSTRLWRGHCARALRSNDPKHYSLTSATHGGGRSETSSGDAMSEKKLTPSERVGCERMLHDLAEQWGMTRGERRVHTLLVHGSSYRHIGERLGISERTVQFHASNIYKKAGFRHRRDYMACVGEIRCRYFDSN